MYKNKYPGKFVVFEGLDGSGQTTQAKLLTDFLKKREYRVIPTKEPTVYSQAGRKIKEVLDEKIAIEPFELQKLFVEDRKEHLENQILPALKKGKFVISDRYFLSTLAFGGLDLDIKLLLELNKDFILPDMTFILDVPAEVCIARIKKRGEGIKYFEKKEKLERVLENYQSLAKRFANVYLINGQLPKDKVFERILLLLTEQYLTKANRKESD